MKKNFVILIMMFCMVIFASQLHQNKYNGGYTDPVKMNRTLSTELIILTVDSLVTYFGDLVELKTEEGFVTEIVTTSTTSDSCFGIRSWLAAEKQSNPSFQYLIIGGDEDIIPTYPFSWSHADTTEISSCDFYYSNVLSTWPDSVDNVMEIDVDKDIYVGRLPIRNHYEIRRYIDKYENYRYYNVDYTDRFEFIATNISGSPGSVNPDDVISEIMDFARDYVTCDSLTTADLVDTLNGAAEAVIDVLQDRDYSFLYMMCHGIDRYVINDDEYDKNDPWWVKGFTKHQQNITIIDLSVEEGGCHYSYQDEEPHEGEWRYYYTSPETKYRQLEDELPSTYGNTYIAWISACMTSDMLYDLDYYPCLRDSNGLIIKNRDISGDLFAVYTDSLPTPAYEDENCIGEVFFNDVGGPIALYSSSFIDLPYNTAPYIGEFFDLQFEDDYHILGYLLDRCWFKDHIIQYSNNHRLIYIGYTLFGDPSMDVWSAKAKQLVLSENIIESPLGSNPTFEVYDSEGNTVEALVCVIDDEGVIQGKGMSPYHYNNTIDDNWIITANKANYIQDRREYEYLKSYSTVPYTMDFEDGLDKNWRIFPDSTYGRIEITTENNPYNGDMHLTMDSNTNGQNAVNSAELHLNLTGETRLILDFYWKEFDDDTHTEDGVFLSDDNGANFTKVYSLAGGSGWENIVLDLDSLIIANSLEYNKNFIIKFQQKDNNPISNDGFAFDDIKVYSQYVIPPYSCGFENGFDDYWFSESSNEHGRVQITTDNIPYSGQKHMTMDVDTTGFYAYNRAFLYLNLEDKSDVELAFMFKDFEDEYQSGDGIYFSDNGGTSFRKVYDLNGPALTDKKWGKHTLDVDALAASASLDLTSQFVIKFQQYDDEPISYAGFAFDDISIECSGRGKFIPDEDIEVVDIILNNYPNPFNPETRLTFSLTEEMVIDLSIYNVRGQLVRNLLDTKMDKGDHSVLWDGKDNTGAVSCSGVYFVRLKSDKQVVMKKLMLLK